MNRKYVNTDEIEDPFPEEITPETVQIAATLGEPPTYSRYLLVSADVNDPTDLYGVEGRVLVASDGVINHPQHAAECLKFATWEPYDAIPAEEQDDLEMLLKVAQPLEDLEDEDSGQAVDP